MTKDEAIKLIESGSSYKLSSVTDEGAFLIPVSPGGRPYSDPFHVTDEKIVELAGMVRHGMRNQAGRSV